MEVLFFLQKTSSGGRALFSEGNTNSEGGGAGEFVFPTKEQTLGGGVCFSYKNQTLGEGFVFVQKTNSGGRGLFFLGKTNSKQTPRGDEQTRKMEVVLPTRRGAARNRFRGVKSEEKSKYFITKH